ncbi:MAG: winged helix-turn-helix domain-containing protein [Bacteroidetes bacterium]|nr:winged helix-turn-helix domain-containing protein [Bacteroidota bacterium]
MFGAWITSGSWTVDVRVRWLRQNQEENSSEPERIVTVRGGGYSI